MRWRRVDGPGHDMCRLLATPEGWKLDGRAVFEHDGAPAALSYSVDCDADWHSQGGAVHGRIGEHPCDLRVTRLADGEWTLNGLMQPGLEACIDLDFGFTPATNLFQLRRIGLPVGRGADVPVAWLDAPAGTLDLLQQRYERRTIESYWYEAPRFDYRALLRVSAAGFVEDYPGLWRLDA